MVVGNREGATVIAECGVEHLSHREKRSIHGAVCQRDDPAQAVARIENDDEGSFLTEIRQSGPHEFGKVRRRSAESRWRLRLDQPPETERAEQRSGLCHSYTAVGGQLLGARRGEPCEPAVLRQEGGGQLDGALP